MKKAIAIVLMLSLLLALPVCGAAEGTESSPAGGYKLRAIAGGAGSDLEIISSVIDLGVSFYLILEEDGSGCMRFLEAEVPLSWDADSIVIPPLGESRAALTLPISWEEGSLTIRTLAYSMDFRAMSEEELADYAANGSGSLRGVMGALVQRLLGALDGDLLESIVSSLAMGMMDDNESEPIPEGEPSEGAVTGFVEDAEYTILGAEHVQDEELGDVIVLYYEFVNRGDELFGGWRLDTEAAQNGEFLEMVYSLDGVPELFNSNYEVCPGRKLRCAEAFVFDPEGGTVGFRIRSFEDGSSLLYYADPQALSGAPAEPFLFDADPTVPEELTALPEENEHVQIESIERITLEDGSDALRLSYLVAPGAEDGGVYYYVDALQDGIELYRIWGSEESDEIAEPDQLRSNTWRLRTGSPVALVLCEGEGFNRGAPVAAVVVELD